MFTKISVENRKLRDYCLNPHHPVGKHKARVFSSQLGIERGDAHWLKKEIIDKIKDAALSGVVKMNMGREVVQIWS